MAGIEDILGPNSRRPDHPDFWRISQILLANDGAIEAATSDEERERVWKQRTESIVERDVVTYVAFQRALRAFGMPGAGAAFGAASAGLPIEQYTKVVALVVDAFVTGAMYQKAGGKQ